MRLRRVIIAIGAVMQLAVASHVRGDVGVVETTGAFLVNGGTATTYISTIGTGNPRWAGFNFGTFDVSAGNTLTLTNFYFENYAYNGGSVPPGGSFNNNWLDGNNTATFRLFRDSTQIYQTFMRQSAVSGNNRFWDLAASGVSVNVLDGLTSGSHTLAYTIDWNYNQWTGSAQITGTTQDTSSGVATFAVVPEPSSLAALVAGGLVSAGWWIRRRRSH
jgi:hypothetical protein